MNHLQAFALFWNIKAPAFITRLSSSMTCREKQDAALYVASLLALFVVAANV